MTHNDETSKTFEAGRDGLDTRARISVVGAGTSFDDPISMVSLGGRNEC